MSHAGALGLGRVATAELGLILHAARQRFQGGGDPVDTMRWTVRKLHELRQPGEQALWVGSAGRWTILPEVIEGTRRGARILASHYPYSGDTQDADRHTFILPHRVSWCRR